MEGVTPEQLLETTDLIAVGVEGDEVRRRMHGTRTTFNRVFELHVDGPRLRQGSGGQAPLAKGVPAVLRQAQDGPELRRSAGALTEAGEFRVIGKPSSLERLISAVHTAGTMAAGVPVTVFSVADLLTLPESIRTVADALRESGASAVVHLPIDRVDNAEVVTEHLHSAGLAVLTIGIQDPDDDRRLELCARARALQSSVGGFKAFAPLSRTMSVAKPTTGYDDVKMVALARVAVQNIESIQVDWALYGPKLAQVVLTVGADDIDAVAAVDPGILGTRRSPLEEIRRNIKAASLEPVQRDALFRVNSKSQTPNSKGAL